MMNVLYGFDAENQFDSWRGLAYHGTGSRKEQLMSAVEWLVEFPAALERAQREGKPVFIDVFAPG